MSASKDGGQGLLDTGNGGVAHHECAVLTFTCATRSIRCVCKFVLVRVSIILIMQQQSYHYTVLAKEIFDHVNPCNPGTDFECIWAVVGFFLVVL